MTTKFCPTCHFPLRPSPNFWNTKIEVVEGKTGELALLPPQHCTQCGMTVRFKVDLAGVVHGFRQFPFRD